MATEKAREILHDYAEEHADLRHPDADLAISAIVAAELEPLLPETFYADSSPEFRLGTLIAQWRTLHLIAAENEELFCTIHNVAVKRVGSGVTCVVCERQAQKRADQRAAESEGAAAAAWECEVCYVKVWDIGAPARFAGTRWRCEQLGDRNEDGTWSVCGGTLHPLYRKGGK